MSSTLSINAGIFALSMLILASLVLSFLDRKRTAQAGGRQQRPVRVVNLNMGIAGVHNFTSQLIGVQLAGANILALALSVLSVVAGTVSVAVTFFPLVLPLWFIAGAVGAGLAVLIEGLTLGALIRIRLANKAIREASKELDQQLSKRLSSIAQPVPGPDVKAYHAQVKMYRAAIKLAREDYRRRLREVTGQHKRFASCVMAFFGALASACAGGIFYHTLFSHLVPWVSLPLSALFPLVVTGTFVSTELFRETQEQAIKEAFRGGSLAEAAIQQETLRLTYQGIHQESVRFMETDEAKHMITAGFKDVLARSIQDMKTVEKPDTSSGQTHIHIEEDTGRQQLLLSASTGQAQNGRTPEQTGQGIPASGHARTSGQYEALTPEHPDKLALTVQFLQEHPDTDAPDYDERLAAHLNMHRPASARFWKIKAQEVLRENSQERNEPGTPNKDQQAPKSTDNGRRIDAYVADHPGAKQTDIASALGITDRTIRRHFERKRTADKADDEDSKEDGHGGLRVVQ